MKSIEYILDKIKKYENRDNEPLYKIVEKYGKFGLGKNNIKIIICGNKDRFIALLAIDTENHLAFAGSPHFIIDMKNRKAYGLSFFDKEDKEMFVQFIELLENVSDDPISTLIDLIQGKYDKKTVMLKDSIRTVIHIWGINNFDYAIKDIIQFVGGFEYWDEDEKLFKEYFGKYIIEKI